jgi:tryptophanyl-tRNA synthetase
MSLVFSGVKPTGTPHIGNYIGSIAQWIGLQKSHPCIFCIVDLHAITVHHVPAQLRACIYDIAATYLAAGVNPNEHILFIQSEVPEHSQLAWILNSLAKVSELKLMHQFKEKSKEDAKNINAALFDYPVLMAADILLYKATHVPVGHDQMQHIEMSRELARRFNAQFGELFPIPQGIVHTHGSRVMGLDNPAKKMAKTASSAYNYILLTDTPEDARDKIKRAVTDSGRDITFSAKKPAVSNLLTIYSALTDMPIAHIEKQYSGKGYKEFKEGLADAVCAFLESFQKKYEKIRANETLLNAILDNGAKRAQKIARQTLAEAADAVGLGRKQ